MKPTDIDKKLEGDIRGRYFRGLSPTESNHAQPVELGIDGTKAVKPLPKPSNIRVAKQDLREAIEKRSSMREYALEPITLEELSFLLWCTQGVKRAIPPSITYRTVPSAGPKHGLETFLLVNRVRDLAPGLYRFLALEHALVEESTEQNLDFRMAQACLGHEAIRKSGVTFVWTAAIHRMKWRYGDRGFHFLLLDAGHVCQNLYLSAQAIECGVCAIADFSDAEMDLLLGLNSENHHTVYLATVGKRPGLHYT